MIRSRQPLDWKDIARHYDDLDLNYRRTWGEHLHHGLWASTTASPGDAVENLANRVMEQLKIRQGAKVCDIGCGYAATSRLIAERYSAQVTGITISNAQIKQAIRNPPCNGRVVLRLMDWLENDLPSVAYDHALSIESSEHMTDKQKFFSEAYRVLKPGGTFVVCAWLARNAPGRLESGLLLEPICRHGRIPSLGSKEEYHEMIQEAGFQIDGFEDLTKRVRKTWSICTHRFVRSALRDPSRLEILFRRDNPQLGFFLSLFRIRAAYALGSMRYGLFSAIKPLSD